MPSFTGGTHAGTGKTYIAINVVRALLAHGANRVLIVTYTNHALDQILEAILDSGLPPEQLLRIGGRRCASTSSVPCDIDPCMGLYKY